MNNYENRMHISIKSTFFAHPKTKRLARMLGTPAGAMHLLQLWAWAADFQQDGNLDGMTNKDISDVSGWTGDPDVFVNALKFADSRNGAWLERDNRLHEWSIYQPWAFYADERKKHSHKAVRARYVKKYGLTDQQGESDGKLTKTKRLPVMGQPHPNTPPPTPVDVNAFVEAVADKERFNAEEAAAETEIIPTNPGKTHKKKLQDESEEQVALILSTKSESFCKVWDQFLLMRHQKKKPATPYAQKCLLRDLEVMTKNETTQIAIIEQSIVGSWTGLFPLHSDTAQVENVTQDRLEPEN